MASINNQQLLKLLQGKPIAFRREFVPFGGIAGALLLSQLLYWQGRQARNDGWLWKTQAEIEEETGLTRREQETARKRLKALGILEEKRMGVPAKMHFRINEDALISALQTSLAESANLEWRNPPNWNGGIRQTNTENTTETTYRESPPVSPPRGEGAPTSPSAPLSRQDDEGAGEQTAPSKKTSNRKSKKETTFRNSEYGGRVPPEWLQFAQDRGLSAREAAVEADRFATYWNEGKGRNTRRRSWKATWRNWIAKHRAYQPEHLNAAQRASEAVSEGEWRKRLMFLKQRYGNKAAALKRWPEKWGPAPGQEESACPMQVVDEVFCSDDL